MCANL
jgi:fatty acid synthase subunit beta, fungi type